VHRRAGVHVLIVDDGAPDGTVNWRRACDGRYRPSDVITARREASAPQLPCGFAWGLTRAYSSASSKDADGSHPHEQLHRCWTPSSRRGPAIGSRYVRAARCANWPAEPDGAYPARQRVLADPVGVDIHDITAGLQRIRREVLEKIDLARMWDSKGYCSS